MEYPNDFDVPSFSAGKTVAFSRGISVWISIVFFLIIAACGFVLLGIHLKKNYPFLISVDPITDDWSIIAYPHHNKQEKIQQYQIIQEKLVKDFVTNWFTISDNTQRNKTRWKNCNTEECSNSEQFTPNNIECAISCKSSPTLFEDFSKIVIPQYTLLVDNNERWTMGRMLITPNIISEKTGRWQVVADISSNLRGTFTILGFVEIERDVNMYPATFGYLIEDFNAYRIANE